MGAAVFDSHERAPEADVDEAASAIKLHGVQRLELQRLACGVDEVIEGADVREKLPYLPLIGEIGDVTFRPGFQGRQRRVDPLPAARCDYDHGALPLGRLGRGETVS